MSNSISNVIARQNNQALVTKIGWFASIMAVGMYLSYIDQIALNVSGQKGSTILPILTTVNCIGWMLYGSMQRKKDWPLMICSVPGIILGVITAITTII